MSTLRTTALSMIAVTGMLGAQCPESGQKKDSCSSESTTTSTSARPESGSSVQAVLAKLAPERKKGLARSLGTIQEKCPIGKRILPTYASLEKLYELAHLDLARTLAKDDLPEEARKELETRKSGLTALLRLHGSGMENLRGLRALGAPVAKKGAPPTAGGRDRSGDGTEAGPRSSDCCDENKPEKAETDCEEKGRAKGTGPGSSPRIGGGDCEKGASSVKKDSAARILKRAEELAASWKEARKELASLPKETQGEIRAAAAEFEDLGIRLDKKVLGVLTRESTLLAALLPSEKAKMADCEEMEGKKDGGEDCVDCGGCEEAGSAPLFVQALRKARKLLAAIPVLKEKEGPTKAGAASCCEDGTESGPKGSD